jgi:hypothetical protein
MEGDVMNDDRSEKERLILRTLRKVLGNIVKDTAPRPDRPNPLQESTIESIRDLFGLIAAREAELADEAEIERNERPYYADEPRDSAVITLHKPDKNKKPN